ncbi:hypothetical protein ACU4GR_33660 (plasmid) [Methylobacterium oryzae CBMB20]
MRDEHRQVMDGLLLKLLAEEGRARECALRADLMAQEGHSNGADAMLRISRRHSAEAMSIRAQLEALHVADDFPLGRITRSGALTLRLVEPAAMTFDQLRERLAGLPLGDVVLLTKAQFVQVFTQAADWEGNRLAAVELAEENGCRLMFREGRDPYAVFTRRQRLSEVISSPRVRSAA